jgi:hypothetical protein
MGMIRTQIQLPEPLHAEIRALCAAKDWTLAEAMRRGAELLVHAYPREVDPVGDWQLPVPARLGVPNVPVDRWRDLAHGRDGDAP